MKPVEFSPPDNTDTFPDTLDKGSCPFRKDEFGKVVEHPFFNPRCKTCQECMYKYNLPAQCPITKQKSFGSEVYDGK